MYFYKLLIFILFTITKYVYCNVHEERLFKNLMENLNPMERPVFNSSEALVVKMRFFLQQIMDVDEKNQVVQVNAWIRYSWSDYKLKWNPEEYDNITDIRFNGNTDSIWKPDILLYNSVDEDFDTTYKSNFVVYSNGDITWIPPGILKFSCKIDVTYFPFDNIFCSLKFGSWTYHGLDLELQIDTNDPDDIHQMDLSDYVTNGEWILVGSPATREVTYYSCCPEPYPTIIFSLHLRRRTMYYSFNLLIPALLITSLSVFGFTLPPDAGEKINLQITILLSEMLFLSMVAEVTPLSEEIPLIGIFFSSCMLVTSASVVFTVVVLNLHFRNADSHFMSPLIKKIFLNFLPWLFMMRRKGYVFRNGRSYKNPYDSDLKINSPSSLETFNEPIKPIESLKTAHIVLLHRIYVELKEISARIVDDDEKEQVENDWKFAAMVVDRVCLVMFTFFILIFIVFFVIAAPHWDN
uniref:Acetylcholine receptor subunit alpha-type acr-16 n=1 Tax=Strongyloides papillosus TaxID=174720 RepID=A0A0N5B820_STREA